MKTTAERSGIGSQLREARRAIHRLEARELEAKRLCDIFETQRDELMDECKHLQQERDEIAATVEKMRDALSDLVLLEADIEAGIFDRYTMQPAKDVLALPTNSSEILAKRDAKVLREAAECPKCKYQGALSDFVFEPHCDEKEGK